jgi:hypothetical protein
MIEFIILLIILGALAGGTGLAGTIKTGFSCVVWILIGIVLLLLHFIT